MKRWTGVALVMICFPLLTLAQSATRLPRTVLPIHYDLTITPDLGAERFGGEERITVAIQQPLRTIVLNALEIDITRATITAEGGQEMPATVTADPASETVTLAVAQTLPIGRAEIRIDYEGILNRQLRGFYIGEYDGRKYVASQMESLDARRAFPSFDEPEMKASFRLTVIADSGDAVISNAEVESDQPGPAAGKHTVRFRETSRMSTYLVALVVGNISCLSDDAAGVPIRICTTPDKLPMARFALEETKGLLRFFNEYYGIDYPFAKLDQIAVSDFAAGAMENTAAIIYRDIYLLLDDANASVDARRGVSTTIAHEIAHQWFGDLVTMRWWNDIWLNEGFANWMGAKGVAAIHPDWNNAAEDLRESATAIEVDVHPSTRAIQQQGETRNEIEQFFDAIAYEKTAAVLRMTERFAGADKFRSAINRYVARNAYANASAGDFFTAIREAAGAEAAAVMESFVTQPGLPVVRVSQRCEEGTSVVTLRQERFFVRGSLLGSAPSQTWTVPICFSDGRCVLLRGREETFRLPGCSPRFANASGSGYYITGYEDAPPSGIGREEHLTLLRDEWLLSRSGIVPAGRYLDLAAAALGSGDERAIRSVLTNVRYLEQYIVGAQDRVRLQEWLRARLRPLVSQLGWTRAPGESDERRELRAAVIETMGISAADPETRRRALTLARRAVSDAKAVDASLLPAVLNVAAAAGDARLFDAFVQGYQRATDPDRRRKFLTALTAFHDPALLRRTLEYSLTDAVRSQDLYFAIGRTLQNPAGAAVAWRWYQQNWPRISPKLPSAHHSIIGNAATTCDLDAIGQMNELAARHSMQEVSRSIALAEERIRACVSFRELQQQALHTWLEDRQQTSANAVSDASRRSMN